MKAPRVLFYAVDGLGLGHVTRLLAIARQVKCLSPDAEIVFLTSSEAEDVIYREGFVAFKVPSKTLRIEGGIRPATYARMVQGVTLNLLAAFHPHLLVVDTFPAGAIMELLPVLRWESRKVFIYRVQRAEVAQSPFFQNTLALYDLAIVPHQPKSVAIYTPEGVKAEWVGPIIIRSREEALPKAEARRQLGLPEGEPVIYVSFGGGGDEEVQSSIEAVSAAMDEKSGPMLAIASPPLYRGAVIPSSRRVPVYAYPVAKYYTAFDAAITSAGYNTAMELLHFGLPAAFLAFPRTVDDQQARAAAIEAAGAGIYLKEFAPAAIQQAVSRLLDPQAAGEMAQKGMAMAPENGARRAAEAVLGLLPD